MKKIKYKLFLTSIFAFCLFGISNTFAQNKLVAVNVSGSYDITFEKSANVEIYEIPATDNPLESILVQLKGNNFNELHIYALTEKDVIVFHGLQLCSENLYMHKEILEKFKQYDVKIIIHSSVLGSDESGQKLLSELSQLMGNPVEVQE